ncbi:hypothetical protein BGE01nite_34660 [Brevifollis gellanilyticus]|uniref:Uncharacterized protein n=1 Tax=Brevifollis gellanilyticus TaxID=748831 RepID=A0A512MBQ6_9BACT|nr:hypothetical protein BGE01nite_34660 [Brevifollis gellanilyticus]
MINEMEVNCYVGIAMKLFPLQEDRIANRQGRDQDKSARVHVSLWSFWNELLKLDKGNNGSG